jgi:hypothetical protein
MISLITFIIGFFIGTWISYLAIDHYYQHPFSDEVEGEI